MKKWRKIGEMRFGRSYYHLHLSQDGTAFYAAGHSRPLVEDFSGYSVKTLGKQYNRGFFEAIKPFLDAALEELRDPSISPNAR